MKKIMLVLVFLGFAMSLSAKTNYINLAYTVNTAFLGKTGSAQSMALSFTALHEDGRGFYTQINPYYGLAVVVNNKGNASFFDSNEFLLGTNTILGYGFDLNNGTIGIILGFGGYLDFWALYYDGQDGTIKPVLEIDNSVLHLAMGLGVAANGYLHPGDGNFTINFGLKLGWAPLYLFEDSLINARLAQSSIHAGFGVGWNY